MKKIFIIFTIVGLLFSCGKKESAKNTLYIYGWADYIPTELYEKFENETGIKVIEDTYSTNEEMFAKIKAGGSGYDILMPSADYSEILLNDNLIEKLDKSQLSNFKNIDSMVLDKLQYFDKNNDYVVPYVMGATVIAVNKKFVNNFPKDFTIYNNSEYVGKMTLLDDMREVMSAALGTLGYSQNTSNENEIAEAAELVKKWKKNIAKFDSESFGKAFANEEFWIVHCYPENIINDLNEEQIKNLEIIIPKKGGVAFIDSFVIPKTAPNKEAAHKFINFIHQPENYKIAAEYLQVPSINVPSRKFIEKKALYSLEQLKDISILRDIKNILELHNKYWQEILID